MEFENNEEFGIVGSKSRHERVYNLEYNDLKEVYGYYDDGEYIYTESGTCIGIIEKDSKGNDLYYIHCKEFECLLNTYFRTQGRKMTLSEIREYEKTLQNFDDNIMDEMWEEIVTENDMHTYISRKIDKFMKNKIKDLGDLIVKEGYIQPMTHEDFFYKYLINCHIRNGKVYGLKGEEVGYIHNGLVYITEDAHKQYCVIPDKDEKLETKIELKP